MIGIVKDVEISSSFRKETKPYGKIENRKTHAFIFKISGSTEYNFDTEKITLRAGDMLYLPCGISYEYTATPGSLYTSINFLADVENQAPMVYEMDGFHKIDFVYDSFSTLWNVGSLSEKYTCLSAFYDVLSYLNGAEHWNDQHKKQTRMMEPAIEYLKAHLFDPGLKTEDLSALCGISDTYFRKLFLARFHASPQEYIISKRISHAKEIIESGDFDSIAEVAELVGYKDPLYFSKAFKKMYGISPSCVNR